MQRTTTQLSLTIRLAIACSSLAVGCVRSATAADESILAVIVGAHHNAHEEYAADQLCHYLNRLYDITARRHTESSPGDDTLLLIGSPGTNPAVAKALGPNGWPDVSDQGIVLKRGQLDDKPALVVGGGSPAATLWAVYELVERWGVRYLLHGDVYPSEPGEFRLPEKDLVLEPSLKVRQWRVVNTFACGPESWGIQDYRRVLDQLAKLKFNRILVQTWPFQPFLHFEVRGVAKKSASLSFNFHYPITDDMVGRKLFDNRSEFWNPDLPLGATYEELRRAGETLVHRILDHAHQRGMQCVMTANLTDFPPEFKQLPGDWQPIKQLNTQTITPGSNADPDDPVLTDLATAVLQATVITYPETDMICLGMPEQRQWVDRYQQAWQTLDDKYGLSETQSLDNLLASADKRTGYPGGAKRAAQEVKGDLVMLRFYDRLIRELNVLETTTRPNVRFVFDGVAEELFPLLPKILPKESETLNFIDYTASRVVRRRDVIRRLDTQETPATLIFTLHDDNVGILPQLATGSLHDLTHELRQHSWAGFSTRYWLIGDHEPCVAYLSRAAWDDSVTPESVYRDQIRAVCGEAAVPDMLDVFREVEAVTRSLEDHGLGLAFPVPGMMIKHLRSSPFPTHLAKDREGYRRALQSAKQAAAKSVPRGRRYVDYWVGRLEFGAGYLDCIEAVQRLASAKQELSAAREAADMDRVERSASHATECAETAVSIAQKMLEAYARVADDQSDRGALAIMAEYVYRPLIAERKRLVADEISR